MKSADLRLLLGYALPYRAALAFCALLMLAESAMALAVPWLGGRLAGSLLADASAAAVTGPILLAQRLFENPPRTASLEDLDRSGEPMLLAGLHAEVDAALRRAGLPPRPAALAGRGSAQAWTLAREDGTALAVVSAQDADALRALLRPLPHYGSQSWLAFDGGRLLERGVWPAPGRLVPVDRAP